MRDKMDALKQLLVYSSKIIDHSELQFSLRISIKYFSSMKDGSNAVFKASIPAFEVKATMIVT